MEQIKQLEKNIEVWLKPVPHLPESWRKWLAENIWWFTVIGIVLSVMGALAILTALSVALPFILVASFFGFNLFSFLFSIVSLVLYVGIIVAMSKAVTPLRSLHRKGWDLMFTATVISYLISAIGLLVNFNAVTFVSSVAGAAIGIAISAYFMFEIRTYFK